MINLPFKLCYELQIFLKAFLFVLSQDFVIWSEVIVDSMFDKKKKVRDRKCVKKLRDLSARKHRGGPNGTSPCFRGSLLQLRGFHLI